MILKSACSLLLFLLIGSFRNEQLKIKMNKLICTQGKNCTVYNCHYYHNEKRYIDNHNYVNNVIKQTDLNITIQPSFDNLLSDKFQSACVNISTKK